MLGSQREPGQVGLPSIQRRIGPGAECCAARGGGHGRSGKNARQRNSASGVIPGNIPGPHDCDAVRMAKLVP